MLHNYIAQFLNYCQVSNFPQKSIEALTARLRHFDRYCQTLSVGSIADVTYQHLLTFVADFDEPSVHVKKNRIWALRHLYHFLKLNHIIDDNLARHIPYPKVERKVPRYLTLREFNLILRHFAGLTNTPYGLRNLIIIMLLGFLGLRLAALLKLNVEDVDLDCGLLRIQEKGRSKRRAAPSATTRRRRVGRSCASSPVRKICLTSRQIRRCQRLWPPVKSRFL